ncbi:MAG: aminotransferase DegT [Flavobacteriales bacterium CG_4_10_14_0_2_um_filter_35_18]|nr:MAG: aminotransferase DegT [Flavobacteriales bacterium CG_4_10_14_0_2_um_filter_35_18]
MKKFKNIIDFIRELYRTPKDFIPLHAPVFRGNEKKYLEECIETTFVSSVGKFVDRFEEMVAEYTGAKKAIVTVNGTNALHLALLSVGVTFDSEVLTQPLTFIATANAIAYIGAKPVFVDVDLDTMGMSPKALKTWLEQNTEQRTTNNEQRTFNKSTGKRISAIVPMHTFGHPCRIDEIAEICEEFNIPLVEDAAESLGSFYKGKHTGNFGKIGVLSFNGNKTITTGGGGMLLTNDEELGKHLKHITTQAKIPHPWEYAHDFIGYNYRMPNLNAALGVAQMEKIDEILASKRKIANAYTEFFNKGEQQTPNNKQGTRNKEQGTTNNDQIKHITEPVNSISNYWLNVILLSNRKERDKFLKFSNDNGVMTRPIWQLMNKLEMFKNCECGDLSNAEWLEDRVVNVPSSVIESHE